jgi:hypothetical protein
MNKKDEFPKEYGFTCPKCKCHEIEEVQIGVTVSSGISGILVEENYTEFIYNGKIQNDGGEVDYYQCAHCGFVIKGGFGSDEMLKHFSFKPVKKQKSIVIAVSKVINDIDK